MNQPEVLSGHVEGFFVVSEPYAPKAEGTVCARVLFEVACGGGRPTADLPNDSNVGHNAEGYSNKAEQCLQRADHPHQPPYASIAASLPVHEDAHVVKVQHHIKHRPRNAKSLQNQIHPFWEDRGARHQGCGAVEEGVCCGAVGEKAEGGVLCAGDEAERSKGGEDMWEVDV